MCRGSQEVVPQCPQSEMQPNMQQSACVQTSDKMCQSASGKVSESARVQQRTSAQLSIIARLLYTAFKKMQDSSETNCQPSLQLKKKILPYLFIVCFIVF